MLSCRRTLRAADSLLESAKLIPLDTFVRKGSLYFPHSPQEEGYFNETSLLTCCGVFGTPTPLSFCVSLVISVAFQVMAGGGFLNNLMTFNKDTINDETVELMAPYLTMEDFNIETAKKVCGDVAGLAAWTRAMAYFYGINKEVLPLKVRSPMDRRNCLTSTEVFAWLETGCLRHTLDKQYLRDCRCYEDLSKCPWNHVGRFAL